MFRMTRKEKQLLVSEILSYLHKNPQACDTLEGIARFWILRHRVDLGFQDVEGAIKELVTKGLLEERVVQSSAGQLMTPNYRLNPSRTRDIEELLLQQNTQ